MAYPGSNTGLPSFSYTGTYQYNHSGTNWEIALLSSGTLRFTSVNPNIDVFVVGGGAAGGTGGYSADQGIGGAGGRGGGTSTKYGVPVSATSYSITIGGSGGASSAFGVSASSGTGAAGGSGGRISGQGSSVSRTAAGAGSDGVYAFGASSSLVYSGVRFGAGGGGGSARNPWNSWGLPSYGGGGSSGGGAGSSGADYAGTAGTANTGGGGGGGFGNFYSYPYGYNGSAGGAGGSGIVIIRNARAFSAAFNLSLSTNTGSNLTVRRTSSSYSTANVNLVNGSPIYSGDSLTITFSPSSNYRIIASTLNGSTISSGATHSVSRDVAIVITAQPLSSAITATNANIEEISTVRLTIYDSSYTHNIEYSFGSLTGTVVSDTKDSSISFTIPATFYAEIPSSKSGTCTLTCKTYSNGTQIGTSSCTFTVTASEERCSPQITNALVEDTNSTTILLTGNSSSLIRYKSDAHCEMSALARNSASISSMRINGYETQTGSYDFYGTEASSFIFSVTDSRGYTTTLTVAPSIIEYVQPTINASLERQSSTSNDVFLEMHGNYYNGSFGAEDNSLMIMYRYMASDETSFSAWKPISSGYQISGNAYSTSTPIQLADSFNYQKQYIVEIRIQDGASSSLILSTALTQLIIKKGVPVFDWGENDFNFNVPVKAPQVIINGETVDQMISAALINAYPVGSIFMSTQSTSPASLFGGTWEQIKDTFLLSAGDTYAAGSTGGEAAHTLTESEMPSHRHTLHNVGAGPGTGTTDYGGVRLNQVFANNWSSYTGGSQPHNNMPPYLAVYAWKRIS